MYDNFKLTSCIFFTKMTNLKISCKFYFDDARQNRKTLFEKAFMCAKDGKVLYILQEELNELPEMSLDLQTVDRNYIKMISFQYTPNILSLIEAIATLPSWQNVPSTIILDDISKYCNKDCFQNACALIALLISITCSCSNITKSPCRLYISSNKEVFTDEQHNTLRELYSKSEIKL